MQAVARFCLSRVIFWRDATSLIPLARGHLALMTVHAIRFL